MQAKDIKVPEFSLVSRKTNFLRLGLGGLGVALLCLVIHSLSTIFACLMEIPVAFVEVKSGYWLAETASLPNGEYYVSLGRPRSPCTLTLNGNLVSRNTGVEMDARDGLLMGGSFSARQGQRIVIEIACASQKGFTAKLTSSPILTTRSSGIVIQLWRGFTQVLLGPLSALILLVFAGTQVLARLIFGNPFEGPLRKSTDKRSYAIGTFAILAFIYALSLAHVTRFWLGGQGFSGLHTILRSLFSLAFVLLCAAYGSRIRWLIYAHVVQIAVTILIAAGNPNLQMGFYKASFVWFSISAIILAIYTGSQGGHRTTDLLARLIAGYALLLPLDYMATFVFEVENLAPTILAILALGTIYLQSVNQAILSTATAALGYIDAAFDRHLGLEELVGRLALLTGKASRFARASAYIDAYLCGVADKPGESYLRVFETGYESSTERERLVSFESGQGQKMREAIEHQKVICDRGEKDKAWYAVVPIGTNACINISDDSRSRRREVNSRLESLHVLLPSLHRFKERVLDHTIKQCLGLERLRARFGHVQLERRIGSIFLDIDNYSGLTETLGQTFNGFVSDRYLPALLKRIGNIAVAEYMRGDELYLVVTEDFLPTNTKVESAVSWTLHSILEFTSSDGAALCEKFGYAPLSIRVGAAIGPALINCDTIKVRTSGKVANDASRLLSCAGPGQIIVRAEDSDPASYDGFESSSIFTVLQKKTVLPARVLVSSTAEDKFKTDVRRQPSLLAEG